MSFIIAQTLGVLSLLLIIVGVQFKTKEQIIMSSIIANVLLSIQYFLLNAITASVILVLNAIRCIVFYLYKKKNLKPSLVTLMIFEIITIISGVLSWQNVWSIIPIVATIVYTYGLWQDNVRVLKTSTAIIGLSWTIYDLMVRAFIAAIQDILQFVSAIISLIRLKLNSSKRAT